MLTHLVLLVAGVYGGYRFKEWLDKNKQPGNRNESDELLMNSKSKMSDGSNISSPNQMDFSLDSIKSVFDAYNVTLIGAGSFYSLLRKIKNQSYKRILKMFIDDATTSEKLVKMLKEGVTPQLEISIRHSNQPPYISDDKLNEYIKEQNVSPENFVNSEEKVKFLLTLYHARGLEDFKNTLGVYLTGILEEYDNGVDTTDSYNEIMKMIKSRYEYLS